MSTVLIGGGTGLVGSHLTQHLLRNGYKVRHLSRTVSGDEAVPTFHWDIDRMEIDKDALQGVEYIINLAGAGIADKRWSPERKSLIIDSRVKTTELLFNACLEAEKFPKCYVSASAIGYYGDRDDNRMMEADQPGKGFLSTSTIAWEDAVFKFADYTRTVALRTGIVLSSQGGALPKLDMTLPYGVLGYFGNGKMWYSWIHIEDMSSMYQFAIENEKMVGPINAVAPNPARLIELVKAIKTARDAVALLAPAPPFVIRLAMGEMADTILSSTRVSSDLIQSLGFTFKHPVLIPALRDIYQKE